MIDLEFGLFYSEIILTFFTLLALFLKTGCEDCGLANFDGF